MRAGWLGTRRVIWGASLTHLFITVIQKGSCSQWHTHNEVWNLTPSWRSGGRDNALDPPGSHPDWCQGNEHCTPWTRIRSPQPLNAPSMGLRIFAHMWRHFPPCKTHNMKCFLKRGPFPAGKDLFFLVLEVAAFSRKGSAGRAHGQDEGIKVKSQEGGGNPLFLTQRILG